MKTVITHHAHSDLDTVWLKGAVRSLAMGLDSHDADVTAATGRYTGTVCLTSILRFYGT